MKYLSALGLLLLLSFSLQGQDEGPTITPELMGEIAAIENSLQPNIQVVGEETPRYRLTERMDHYKVPGVSIAVVKDGQLHWAKGYGYANTELGTPVTTETLFQAGSISKPVAALAALRLVDEGKVDLDTDVNQYLRDWQVPESPFTANEKVTLRRLLTHSAGMTVHGFPGYAQADAFPTDIDVLNGNGNTAAIVVDTVPGTLCRYSGGGYTVMERVVENVTGQSFQDYMAAAILQPLGMTNSTYAQPLPEEWHQQASAAYDSNGELIEGLWHNYPEQAAAGLWTTPTDLALYAQAMQEILAGKTGQILLPDRVKEMLSRHLVCERGLGPALSGEGQDLMFGHGGKNAGFTNNMVAYAYRGDALIVMTSADNGWPLIQEIMLAVGAQYGWEIAEPRRIEPVEMTASKLQAMTGHFQFIEKMPGIGDYIVEISVQDGQLQVFNPHENQTLVLTPLGDGRFIVMETGDELHFKTPEEGKLTFFWNGTYEFFRLGE